MNIDIDIADTLILLGKIIGAKDRRFKKG